MEERKRRALGTQEKERPAEKHKETEMQQLIRKQSSAPGSAGRRGWGDFCV
jgi:hypothetical protein